MSKWDSDGGYKRRESAIVTKVGMGIGVSESECFCIKLSHCWRRDIQFKLHSCM